MPTKVMERDADTRPAIEIAKPLSPAARRALDEAEVRRAARQTGPSAAKELAGRGGAEPTRYGDWEVRGLATDF